MPSLKIAYFLADTTEVEVAQLLDTRYADCDGDVDVDNLNTPPRVHFTNAFEPETARAYLR